MEGTGECDSSGRWEGKKRIRKTHLSCQLSWKQYLTSLCLYRHGQGAADAVNKTRVAAFPAAAEAIPDKTAKLSGLDIRLLRDLRELWGAPAWAL